MNKLKYALLLLLALHISAFSADTKPSEASIKEVLAVTKASQLYDSAMSQMDHMTNSGVQQALKGKKLNADEQKVIDRMRNKMVIALKQTMSWESMEALYIKVYREAFTQEELDGMLAFYRSPAGQAVINKLPTLMTIVMREMVQKMEVMKPRMEQIVNETLQEFKDLEQQKSSHQPVKQPVSTAPRT